MGIEQQIFGVVAGQRQFGREPHIRGRGRGFDRAANARGVAGEIADAKIQLQKTDPHGRRS